MLLLSFFQWWYGPGWVKQLRAIGGRINSLSQTLSVSTLLRTLWSPWKQVVSHSRSHESIQIKFSAVVDNTVSRFVGFMIRSVVLMIALVGFVVTFVVSVGLVVVWPVLPVLVVLLIPLGFII